MYVYITSYYLYTHIIIHSECLIFRKNGIAIDIASHPTRRQVKAREMWAKHKRHDVFQRGWGELEHMGRIWDLYIYIIYIYICISIHMYHTYDDFFPTMMIYHIYIYIIDVYFIYHPHVELIIQFWSSLSGALFMARNIIQLVAGGAIPPSWISFSASEVCGESGFHHHG